MPNQIIERYLKDKSIPLADRQQALKDIEDNVIDENAFVESLNYHTDNKYAQPNIEEVGNKLNQLIHGIGDTVKEVAPKVAREQQIKQKLQEGVSPVTTGLQKTFAPTDEQLAQEKSGAEAEMLKSGMSPEDVQVMGEIRGIGEPGIIQKTGRSVVGGLGNLVGGSFELGKSLSPFSDESASERIIQGGAGIQKAIGGGIEAAFAPVTAAATSVPGVEQGMEFVGSKINDAANSFSSALGIDPNSEQGKAIAQGFQNITALLGAKYGETAGKMKSVAKGEIPPSALTVGDKMMKPVVQGVSKTGELALEGASRLREGIKNKRNALAESIMNSNIKVDPAKGAEHFYKLSKGQTMGEFLLERDIIGTPEEVVTKLAKRFNKSKTVYENGVASIEGNYKFPVARDILQEMKDRFERTRDTVNGPVVDRLLNKYDSEGLTMAENLQAKRLYESKVKTGYLKDNNSELVDRATNQDTQLREAFNSTAEKRGFTNIKELSRETQLSRAAMDSIESKAIRRLVNNQYSLTDNLLLVGGAINPSSLAVLGVKKIMGLPSVQAKIVKALATNDIKIMKEIPNVPREIINESNVAKRQMDFENWLRESGLADLQKGTNPKMLNAPKDIQMPGASDILEVRAQQYREGKGIFEGTQRSVKAKTTPKKIINKNPIDSTISPSSTKSQIPPIKWLKKNASEVSLAQAKKAFYMEEGATKVIPMNQLILESDGAVQSALESPIKTLKDFDKYSQNDSFFIYKTKNEPSPFKQSEMTQTIATRIEDASVKAYERTIRAGGTTMDLNTMKIKEGIAFAPSKTTEFKIPVSEFNPSDVAQYIKDNYGTLKGGEKLGTWFNPEDNMIYLDISRTLPESQALSAVKQARAAKQEGVFNIGKKDYQPIDTRSNTEIAKATQQAKPPKALPSTGKYSKELGDLNKIDISPTGTNRIVAQQREILNKMSPEDKSMFIRFKNKSGQAYEGFKDTVLGIAKDSGVKTSDTSFWRKSDGRAIEKIFGDRVETGARTKTLKDMNRADFVTNSPAKIKQLIEKVKNEFGGIVESKNYIKTPTIDGYRSLNLVVRTKNGTLAEIQIIPENIAKVKAGPGHLLYEKARSSNDSLEIMELNGKMKDLYNKAWELDKKYF